MQQQFTPDQGPRGFTQEQIQEILDAAIARHGQVSGPGGDTMTIEDALEIARSLSIPEEHVMAAAEEVRQRHERQRQAALRAGELHWRREAVRRRRRAAFFTALGAIGGVQILLLVIGAILKLFPIILIPVAALGIPLFVLLMRWLFVADEEAGPGDVVPVAGRCRVCGKEAHSPRATFCEAHRYKGPA